MTISGVFRTAKAAAKSSALALPGQGIDVRNAFAPFRSQRHVFELVLRTLDDALGERVSSSLLNETDSPKLDLMRTYYAQPVILATTLAIYEYIRRVHGVDLVHREETKFVLGHSLGEYTALAVTGVMDLHTAVQMVRKRAELMENVGAGGCEMRALMFRPASFEVVLHHCDSNGILANVNSHQQVVVAGTSEKILLVLAELPKRTIAKTVQLPVKIPFHTEILRPIESELAEWVRSKPLGVPKKPIVVNLTGEALTDPHQIVDSVIRTNSRPVQWVKSMKALESCGVQRVYSMGPGEVLHGLNGRFMESVLLSVP